MVSSMYSTFRLSNEEYGQLEKEFDKLCKYASWQLKRKNAPNNMAEDVEDIIQECRIAVMRAGVYYKRQLYIECCLQLAKKHVKDKFMKKIVEELDMLWNNRTKHGANKQKYGPHQEALLDRIITQIVPLNERPDKNRTLEIDNKFIRYCKQITWNQQKSLGKKITRERSVRVGAVSLSAYDYLSEAG